MDRLGVLVTVAAPRLYSTYVGKKYAMAVSGIVLMLYVLTHMLGNLKLYLGAPDLDSYAEWLRTAGEPGAQPQQRAARQVLHLRQAKASQLGSARSRESQSTWRVSQLPLGTPAPLHIPPVSRRSTIADDPPPSSSTAVSEPSPRNRS